MLSLSILPYRIDSQIGPCSGYQDFKLQTHGQRSFYFVSYNKGNQMICLSLSDANVGDYLKLFDYVNHKCFYAYS